MAQVRSLKTGIKFKDTPIGKIPMDWNIKSLNNVTTVFYNGGTPNTKVKEYWDGNIPWITGADFINQEVNEIRRYITIDGVKNSATNVVPKGNLLVVTRTGVGKLAIAPSDIAISQDITGVIADPQQMVPIFLFHYLNSNEKRLKALKQGTSINGILREDLSSLLIGIPPLPEQKKIAEILSNVDDAIEETDRIIEKTKELKKGLMQNLLTKGIGHKKFKKTEIGKIPKEWEVVKLMDISKVNPEQIGNSYPKKNQIKYLDISGITQTGYIKEIKDVTFEEAPSRARRVAQKNDILVSTVRPYLRAFARIKTSLDNFIVSTGYAVIRPENPEDSEYIYQNILNEQFIKFLLPHMTGTNYPAVRPNDIGNYSIAFPTENERKEITKILSLVDIEIENEESKKQKLKTLKKSLMQVLLTGKKRVKIS